MKKELSFSPSVREAVRERDDFCCADCFKEEKGSKRFQVHHKIPRRLIKSLKHSCDPLTLADFKQYIKSEDNGVLLCPTCHRYWDELSFDNVYFGWDKPLGIPVRRLDERKMDVRRRSAICRGAR